MSPKDEQNAIRQRCLRPSAELLEFGEADCLQSIGARFSRVVSRYPNNLAVLTPDATLTYAALNSRANQIANATLGLAIGTGARVGMLIEAGTECTAAHLGLIKAGYVRISLNPRYAVTQLLARIERFAIRCLVSSPGNLRLARQLAAACPRLAVLPLADVAHDGPVSEPADACGPNSPTVIGFSSGSTGEPTGVIRDHLNELHSTMRVANSMGLDTSDRMLSSRNGPTLFLQALLSGACFCPYDLEESGDFRGLADWMRESRVSIYRSPVSTFRGLTQSLRDGDTFPDVRLIVLQGEPVFRADVQAFQRWFDDRCVLISSLGVSQLGDFAHFRLDKSTRIAGPTVPGGYPLQGVSVTIAPSSDALPSDGPDGSEQIGEIVVRGQFIGEFVHRPPACEIVPGRTPTVTRESFATSDVGYLDEYGCVHHAGRLDFQVKVRGYRVDLLEVEAALLDLGEYSQVAVCARTDDSGDVTLVAYIEADVVDQNQLRQALARTLPAQMIPKVFVALNPLPRTQNGKINRRLLPSAIVELPASGRPVAPPVGAIQEKLVDIWTEVLKAETIGVNDKFLALGGDSIKAMLMMARVNEAFSTEMTIVELFDTETIEQLAGLVESKRASSTQNSSTDPRP